MLIYKTYRIEFDDFERMASVFPETDYFKRIIEFAKAWLTIDNNTFEFKTSGSTGKPKLHSHSRTSILESISKTRQYFSLQARDKALLAMPVEFVGGKMMLARAIVLNLDLYINAPSLAPLSLYPDTPFDFVPITPLQLEHLLDNNLESVIKIKTILLGGAPVSAPLMARIEELENTVCLGYGMTETLTHVAIMHLNGPLKSDVYTVLDGIQIHSREGCLIIESDHLAKPVLTNDLVEIIDPNHFKWLGRKDLIINSGGVKIDPEALELSLAKKFNLTVVFIGLPNQQLGEKLVLIVEDNQANTTFDELEIKRFIESNFSKYHVPKQVYVIENIPRTKTGKVDRYNLQISLDKIIDAH